MKKRTNTAFWVEKEKRWCIAVQKNGTRKRFYSSTPGRTGQREANAKADAWLDDGIVNTRVLVEKLYNQMINYRNQIMSIDASLSFAEEYLRMKEAAFREGMSSSSDLIDAELNLAGVRTERLQAAYNFDLVLAQLLEAAGISDEFPAYSRRSDARVILFDEK